MATLKEKIQNINNNILKGKTEIAEALSYVGIKDVLPSVSNPDLYETFKSYADKIKRLTLRTDNAFIFEITIPDNINSDYKRTLVLPRVDINLNDIAKTIIKTQQTNNNTTTASLFKTSKQQIQSENTVEDIYGNEVCDGLNIPTIEEAYRYLPEEEAKEYEAMTLSLRATTEVASDMDYDYTVDWGDGNIATYKTNTDTAAIYHTYQSGGTYDITITGTFKKLKSTIPWQTNLVENGQEIKDIDGIAVVANTNYAMSNYLTTIISWGNTGFTDLSYGLCCCYKLSSIPMYDTINSFTDVINFSYMFAFDSSLKNIPFNQNTNKGLFSNCKKAEKFDFTFYQCTGLIGNIPDKLIDGCENCKTIEGIFGYSSVTGNIPNGFHKGLINLQRVGEAYAGTKINGTIADDFFVDSPNINYAYRTFYKCTGLTGTITKGVIGRLNKCTDFRQCFYGCSGVTAIDADAFYDIKADNILFTSAFDGCSGLKEIPTGLLESLTGKNLTTIRMFADCTGLLTLADTALKDLNIKNAAGMFSGDINLSSSIPQSNKDWDTLDGITKWIGCFALNDKMTGNIPQELGGNNDRKFPDGKIGSILLADKTTIDINKYTYNPNNKPIGVVYAQAKINDTGQVTTNGTLKTFACALNEANKLWIGKNIYQEDITNLPNNGYDYNPGYNFTRYAGKIYTDIVRQWIKDKGYTDDRYPAFTWIDSYVTDGTSLKDWWIADISDIWNLFGQIGQIKKACNKIITGGGNNSQGQTFNNSNCYSLNKESWYWTSSETSVTSAMGCSFTNAYLLSGYKWSALQVRPCISI